MNRVIREPRLLPYYMDRETVAALVGVSCETVDGYCRRGIWKRGVHFTQPNRRRRFHRDPILRWLDEADRSREIVPVGKSKVDLSRSPALAAEIARGKCLA